MLQHFSMAISRNQRKDPGRQCFSVSSHVTAHVHEEGVVILDRLKGCVFVANRVGARLWQAVCRREVLESALLELSREYGVPPRQVGQDAERFLAELLQNRLIEIVEPV